MPSIVCRSRIRAVSEHCSLSLGVRHHLHVGGSSHPVCRPKETRFPDNVDVLLTSNLVITLSGDLDGEVISAEEMYASELAQNLVDYLQLNAAELGLNCVSKLKLDEGSGVLQFVLTSSRQYPADPETLPVHVLLVAIDLCYSWRTLDCSQAKPNRANHPFNERLSLPYKTVLDNVIRRFVTWQLVKRYPLIFGPWRQQLDIDSVYFREASRSLLRIMRRSPDEDFRSSCKSLIKIIRARRIDAQRDAAQSLSAYLCTGDDEENSMSDITDEDALCYALERVYRNGMSRPQFKGLASMPAIDRADDEDLACNHADYSHEVPSGLPFYESFLWDEVFNDVPLPTSPNPPASDSVKFLSDGKNFSVDIELDHHHHHHQDILEEDEVWNDCELSVKRLSSSLKINQNDGVSALIQETDCTTLSSLFDFDDSDDETSFNSSQEATQYENIDIDGFVFGTVFRLPDSHVVHDESPSDRDSQDEGPHNLGMEDESQTPLTSSLLPSISEPLSNWENHSMEPPSNDEEDISIFPLEAMDEFIPPEPHDNEDDLELDFLSDGTCSGSNDMDIAFEPIHGLFENHGDSVGVVVRRTSSGSTSHQVPTLNVTWPSQAEREHQTRYSLDGFEDTEEELWDIEVGEEESELCVAGGEISFMMELDNLTP